ncbi:MULTISPECIES: 3'-5' exonuclease [Pectobacterium]|uniref:Exonuclease domain-containing protein n=1 Tax=Pectobacterium wasabiae TaxID=55208 RepID=A0AAW3EFI5_9GAMM|nr:MULTISPECIES: 3'-5' exonuclease [Pectobacterium]AOR65740.1 hypothetical protein A7983_21230 [Pectobacterium wasabiae CFBP 3304]EJS96690.1 Exonuclease RNase T and DNA polymerase III [Pectobacterium wasabiae CFBP 3304]KFX05527.1 hypothetical protein JV38_12595 [Pectobacterium wasabiae]KGA30381.1 hypothetical protein KU73_00220 [Pectobacterium wasabiae]UMO89962.1 exonuclease domain-containing protein [Pectobacterium sp. PL64]
MNFKKRQAVEIFRDQLSGSRYLICLDVEATCDDYPKSMSVADRAGHSLLVTPEEMEIIEIGIVALDLRQHYQVVTNFSQFVQPIIHPDLTPFCKALTGIKQNDVDSAQPFSKVSQIVDTLLQPFLIEGVVWCSWGTYDADQIKRDCVRLGVKSSLNDLKHLPVDLFYSNVFDTPAPDLKKAVESLEITWEGQYHRALDDSRHVALLVTKLLETL